MNNTVRRTAGVVAAVTLTATAIAGCSNNDSDDNSAASASASASMAMTDATSTQPGTETGSADSVEVTAADGSKVMLSGPIAKKYAAATDTQKADLGKAMTGADASGESPNGVVFQQFEGGVITAKNADAPAYITWGKIRDAWNVKRDDTGKPSADGKGGSQGPLGVATSDETDEGSMKVSTFEHGKITWTPMGDKIEVTVNGEVVPAM